jgi:hypothetical protein
MSSSSTSTPREAKISETWDSCIEKLLLKTSTGFVLGGLAAVVLFRGPAARGLASGLAAGFGAGLAWNDCSNAFNKAGLKKSDE